MKLLRDNCGAQTCVKRRRTEKRHGPRTLRQGFRFRRQVVLSGFIVDFACYETRLIIEVDRSDSLDRQRKLRWDARRDEMLRAKRQFCIEDSRTTRCFTTLDGVIETIRSRLLKLVSTSPRGRETCRGDSDASRAARLARAGRGDASADRALAEMAIAAPIASEDPRPITGDGPSGAMQRRQWHCALGGDDGMGKVTGFLEIDRADRRYAPASDRIRHYREFMLPLSEESTRNQAARCMNCGIPYCHNGCPVNNQIPDWNDLVYRARLAGSLAQPAQHQQFPGIHRPRLPRAVRGVLHAEHSGRPR